MRQTCPELDNWKKWSRLYKLHKPRKIRLWFCCLNVVLHCQHEYFNVLHYNERRDTSTKLKFRLQFHKKKMARGLNIVFRRCVLGQTLQEKWRLRPESSFKRYNMNANENLDCVLQIQPPAVHMPHAYLSLCSGSNPESSRGWCRTKQTEGEHKSMKTASSCAVCFSTSVTVFDTAGCTCAAPVSLLTHFRRQHCVELTFLKH